MIVAAIRSTPVLATRVERQLSYDATLLADAVASAITYPKSPCAYPFSRL